MPAKTLCVFCGSSSGFEPAFGSAASALGTTIGTAGHNLVYGGGHVGLMGVVADSVMAAGGSVTGVMTEQLVSLEVAHGALTTLDVQPSMHDRKARMAELADGVIVLPGGFGTWEEALEVLTWNQLGLVAMPTVFLDVNGFFDPLFEFIAGAVAAGFVNSDNASLAQRTVDAADAVARATGPAPAYSAKWIG